MPPPQGGGGPPGEEGKVAQEEPQALPYDGASLVSQWTFHWVEPVLVACRHGLLTVRTLYRAPRWLSSKHDAAALLEFWALKEHSPSRIGWVWMVLAMGGWTLWWSGLLALSSDLLQQATTQSKSIFVNSFERADLTVNERLWYGLIMLLALFGRKLVLNKSLELLSTLAYMVRAGLMGAAYQRMLGAQRFWNIGASFNKLAIDCNRIATLIIFGHLSWSNPLRVILGLTTAYKMMGRCAVPGILFILFILCSLFWFASQMRRVRKRLARLSDERLELTGQILRSIRTIKSLGLEEYYYGRIDALREEELRGISRLNRLFAVAASVNFWSPVVAASISVAMAVLYDERLRAGTVFGTARAFQALMIPLWVMPSMANRIMASAVATDRIDQVLREPQMTEASEHEETREMAIKIKEAEEGGQISLELERVTFVTDGPQPLLTDISMTLRGGTVTGITGATASGKSALLSGLAGLLSVAPDSQSSIAFSSGDHGQHHGDARPRVGLCLFPAWVHSGTVAENIVFGADLDQEWLRQVMQACCLEGELESDQQVGEVGTLLSGGQRQRIALARALYARPQLLLIDDILTSMDAEVVEHVWEGCFGRQALLPTSIKVLVSTNPTILRRCDQLFQISERQVAPLSQSALQEEADGDDSFDDLSEENSCSTTWPVKGAIEEQETLLSWERLFFLVSRAAGGRLLIVLLFAVTFGTDLSRLARDYLFGAQIDSQGTEAEEKMRFLLYLCAFGILQGIFTVASNLFAVRLCLRASRQVQRLTLRKILFAKMSALAQIPSGHLLNRLGKDLETLDYTFPERLISLLGSGSSLICAILSVACYAPRFLPTLVIPALGIFLLQGRFAKAWRTLLRLNSRALAPISTMLSQSFFGLPTIRAHHQTDRFVHRFQGLLDTYSVASVLMMTVRRWVSLRCEAVATLYVGGLAVYCVFAEVPGKVAGLLMLHALIAAESIDYFVKHIAEVDHSLIAVERTAVYASRLPLEGEEEDGLEGCPAVARRHHHSWKALGSELRAAAGTPSGWEKGRGVVGAEALHGDLIFENLAITYGHRVVLAGLNLAIGRGERVAIVGRTGVGKSSLVSVLLGMCEYRGRIFIGGRDVHTIPLAVLRHSIVAVLQESALLDVPIRESLDPLGEYGDEHLWSVLGELGLAPIIQKLEGKLDSRPATLSVGQRQLICVARALLRRPKILLLDEATSALDPQEDAALHRRLFALLPAEATIVTITHRTKIARLYQRIVQLKGTTHGDARLAPLHIS